jgi:hypothetical protein
MLNQIMLNDAFFPNYFEELADTSPENLAPRKFYVNEIYTSGFLGEAGRTLSFILTITALRFFIWVILVASFRI